MVASILYYELHETELPKRDYSKQDIHYIIEQLVASQKNGIDQLASDCIH